MVFTGFPSGFAAGSGGEASSNFSTRFGTGAYMDLPSSPGGPGVTRIIVTGAGTGAFVFGGSTVPGACVLVGGHPVTAP
jgi:hypothetical protein